MWARDGRAGARVSDVRRQHLPHFTNGDGLHRATGRPHCAEQVTDGTVAVIPLSLGAQPGAGVRVSSEFDHPVRVVVELMRVAQPRHAKAAEKCGEQDDGDGTTESHGAFRTLSDRARSGQDASRRFTSVQLITFQNALTYSARRF